MDIGTVAGGYGDATSQDAFCSGATCTISLIYDQSPNHNDLKPEAAGAYIAHPDSPANATALPLTISGHHVYGIEIEENTGYRNNCGGTACPGVAVGDEPETVYMLASGASGNYNGQCCFDYGNAETNSSNDGSGTMETVSFGNIPYFSSLGTGSGPWVESDMENGVYAGDIVNSGNNVNPTNMSLPFPYVTAMVIGRTATNAAGSFALYGANAQSDMAFQVEYDGPRPPRASICTNCGLFVPMRKQGAIVLGTGGDNSNGGKGNFYEGVMTAGSASEATADAVEANIVAAGYGK